MNNEERDGLLSGLSPTMQRIYAALDEQGPLTSPGLREPTGRGDGMTVELERMCLLGLIRPVGTEPRSRGISPTIYAATPVGEIEAAAKAYSIRKKKRKKKRGPSRTHVADLRKLEHGSFGDWYRVRRRVVELSRVLVQIEPMAFWEVAPEDDRALALGEIRELHEWAGHVIECLDQREADDGVRNKIEKLERTNGRSEHEVATGKKLADKLRERL
jgi:hypothetical protein